MTPEEAEEFWADDEPRPDYHAAVRSFVDQSKAVAAVERERDELRAERDGLRADWRKVTRTLGYGDGITEPQIDVDNFISIMEESARDASKWRESQLWRGDCRMAGHPDDEDCFEHDPSLRLGAAEATLARVDELAERWWNEADANEDTHPREARAVHVCVTEIRAALKGGDDAA